MMNLKSLALVLITLLFLVPTGGLLAGTVILKNGHVVTGKIIANDEEKVILTWANGRATIYHRFVDEVVLESSEVEYLAKRYDAQVVRKSGTVNVDIELPELAELLEPVVPEVEQPVRDEIANPESVVTEAPVPSRASDTDVVVLDVIEEPELPRYARVELEGLGLFIDVPTKWESVSATDAARVVSEDGSVVIAIDRYPGQSILPEQAAVILGDRLKKAGFITKSRGRASLLSVLNPAFISESVSFSGSQFALHGLIPGIDGTMLVSVYTSAESDSYVDGVIASILTSLRSPIASR
ncbi:MAG: hypothetical protein AAEJ47_07405 [Planctomycetota bacterium]